MFSNHISDKEFVYKICEVLLQLNNEKMTQLKIGQMIWTAIFAKAFKNTLSTISHYGNANQNHFIPIRMAKTEKEDNNRCWKAVKKFECTDIGSKMSKWPSNLEQFAIPCNVMHRISMWPRNSIPMYIAYRNEAWKMCTWMFIAVLF